MKMETMKHYNLKPSIGGSFSFAWSKIYEKAFLPLLLAVIIVGLLNGPAGATWKMDGDFNFGFPMMFLFPVILFGLAYSFLFLPIIKYGENLLFVKAMRDEEADIKYLFEGFKTRYLNIVLANLIVTALVMIGFVMLNNSGYNYTLPPVVCSVFSNG
jgi:E3 ubiquitin-protein ligase DOA10